MTYHQQTVLYSPFFFLPGKWDKKDQLNQILLKLVSILQKSWLILLSKIWVRWCLPDEDII
jgi:hypothetical protein